MSSMNVVNIIELKSQGTVLSEENIRQFVQSVANNNIDDSQIGAFLMSVKLKGMNAHETAHLTKAMADNSYQFDWSKYNWNKSVVDKHSTGGVGDKISHILAPVLSACGLKLPMISGRGLGITGGTIDKLESIKGFYPIDDFTIMPEMLETVGFFITGQTNAMVPVDKRLYAIRDVTATVNSIPLITASILSKKKIEDIKVLLMDIKFGVGTFMQTEAEANELAKSIMETGKSLNLDIICCIDDMNSPLGNCIGNALEIAEVLQALNGKMSSDIKELIYAMASHLIKYIENNLSDNDITEKINHSISSGEALKRFSEMLLYQGVSKEVADKLCVQNTLSVEDYLKLLSDSSVNETKLSVKEDGYIQNINAEIVGKVTQSLGGGRSRKDDKLDYRVGIELLYKEGDYVKEGMFWVKIYHASELKDSTIEQLQSAILVGPTKPSNLLRIKNILHPKKL